MLPVGYTGEIPLVLPLIFISRSRGNNDKSPSSPEQSSKKEKKEKKSWLKLKYGRKEKKRVPAPEPESGWYKEGGLPSTYDKPVVKEKKKYSYIDEDEESSDVVAESGRYQRRAGSEKVLSAYREYQESSDVERGKQDQTDVRPTDPKQSLSINSATGPPPLLSQRRNSAPPVTTTQNPITPSYQPKPVQAPPLLSQRSKEIANPLLLQSDVEVSDSMRSRQSASQVQCPCFQSSLLSRHLLMMHLLLFGKLVPEKLSRFLDVILVMIGMHRAMLTVVLSLIVLTQISRMPRQFNNQEVEESVGGNV